MEKEIFMNKSAQEQQRQIVQWLCQLLENNPANGSQKMVFVHPIDTLLIESMEKNTAYWEHWYAHEFVKCKADRNFNVFDDVTLMQLVISVQPSAIEHASARVKQDHSTMMLLAKWPNFLMRYVPKKVLEDPQFMRQVLVENAQNATLLHSIIEADAALTLWALEQYERQKKPSDPGAFERSLRLFLRKVPSHVMADEKIAHWLIERNGRFLFYLSPAHRSNPILVQKAIEQNPLALEFANSQMRSNRKLVCGLLRKEPSVLAYAEGELKRKKRLVLWATHKCSSTEQADRMLDGLYQKWHSEILIMYPLMKKSPNKALRLVTDKLLKGTPWSQNTLRYKSLDHQQVEQLLKHMQYVYERKIASQQQQRLYKQVNKIETTASFSPTQSPQRQDQHVDKKMGKDQSTGECLIQSVTKKHKRL